MVARCCSDWVIKRKDLDGYDVTIPEYGFKIKLNLTKDWGTWLIATESIYEIGCIFKY